MEVGVVQIEKGVVQMEVGVVHKIQMDVSVTRWR